VCGRWKLISAHGFGIAVREEKKNGNWGIEAQRKGKCRKKRRSLVALFQGRKRKRRRGSRQNSARKKERTETCGTKSPAADKRRPEYILGGRKEHTGPCHIPHQGRVPEKRGGATGKGEKKTGSQRKSKWANVLLCELNPKGGKQGAGEVYNTGGKGRKWGRKKRKVEWGEKEKQRSI